MQASGKGLAPAVGFSKEGTENLKTTSGSRESFPPPDALAARPWRVEVTVGGPEVTVGGPEVTVGGPSPAADWLGPGLEIDGVKTCGWRGPSAPLVFPRTGNWRAGVDDNSLSTRPCP